MTDLHTGIESADSSTKLAAMARIFHLLGTDCKTNIDIILEQTCHIFEAACSLYNRIDNKEKSMIVWAGHNLPQDLEKECAPQGHICWEATIKGDGKPVVIENLEKSSFYESDPYVQRYDLKSYLGFPIRCRNQVIGSLCIVDVKTRTFSAAEINCIQTLSAALSLEEERAAMEQDVFIEKERYRLLVETANDAIYIIQDGVLKFTNPKTIAMSGYSAKELENFPFINLIHPDDREQVKENHIRRLNGEDIPTTYSFKAINKQNETLVVQINAVPIIWEKRPAILYCTRDLTRITALEKKLQRAEKMELIGTMAGGVAHDLNNILSGLVSYPELLLMQIEKDSPLTETITLILESGLKAAEIVQDLLTLTRRGVAVETVANLNHIIQEYFQSPAHTRLEKDNPDIKFNTRLEPDLLNLFGSSLHISKIIMNLVINGVEAISGIGEIRIETYNRYIDAPLKGYDAILEGDYVVLRIRDNGVGISDKDLERIFEPFYTKKKMGRSGTGLGLSVVWNSVKDHKGYIEVKSKKEEGTVFELYFPATRKETGREDDSFKITDFQGNQQTVLVVDDIEGQRKMAYDCLKLLKYSPSTVASGEKAIEFLKKQPMDILLLDMKMDPGIDGLETYRQAVEINPAQKAIIASGFSENIRIKEALRIGAGQYIKKPYTIKKLAHALKKELN